jgi:hypothetical protein
MSLEKERKYQGLAIALLLGTESGLNGDLTRLKPEDRTPENVKKLLRHAMYYDTSAFNAQNEFKPQSPNTPDPALDETLTKVKYQTLFNHINTFQTSSEAMTSVLSDLFFYSGGSCPTSAEQREIFRTLHQLGKEKDKATEA